ncbi:amino acid adenylation domain-containing protein, partial [Pseudomonas sp. 3MA1]|uniref:non-ribosomal peptide synthetase n=1 Tax=Pseudomonas sp. 3MA1 TaxID=2699196 RepID=UPI0023DDBD7B
MKPQTFPLTAAQKAIWLDQISQGDSPLYNIGNYLEIQGPIVPEVMQRAVQLMVDKHDALRLTLVEETDADGVPLQAFVPAIKVEVPFLDFSTQADPVSTAMAFVEEHMARSFPMTEAPLCRFFLIKLADTHYWSINQAHHIILDGWAFGEMLQSLGALYSDLLQARQPDMDATSYLDFIHDDLRYRESARYAKDRDYWQAKYQSLPEPLFTARHHNQFAKGKAPGRHYARPFPVALHERMGELAKDLQASTYHVLLAAMYVYFTRVTQRDEWVVGLPLLNRTGKFKGTVGMFTQVSAVRFSLGRELTFSEVICAVRDGLKQDYRHQRFPLSGLNLRNEGGQLFDVTLSYEQDDHLYQFAQGLGDSVKVTNSHEQMPLAFHLRASNLKDKAWAHYVYNEAYFNAEEIQCLAERFTYVLEQALDNAALAVNDFSLTTERDRALLQHWNAGSSTPASDATLHGLFEAQAASRPDATAVVFHEQRLSYAELNQRANRVAHRLLSLGVRPDDRVAICVERGLEMIVGLLGILKAGAGYVPIDPAYPQERISYTLQDSAPAAVLVQAATQALVAELAVPVVDLDAPSLHQESIQDPHVEGLTATSLAYVIYTSGSTGLPKGVMIEHANVTRLFTATDAWFGFNPEDVWALFHSFAFDFSVWEIWGALIHGGQLLVVPQVTSRSPDECYALLCSAGVTILNQTPSAFRSLIAAQGQSALKHSLRQVIFGGEALEPAILKPWYARMANSGTQLVNMYGITETTVHVTYRALTAADAQLVGTSPIGGRIPDLRLYVLDAQGRPVPHGVEGELYVGGAGVARGYLNRPELNAERFVHDPFDPTPGARMYRTGDLGRWQADGSIDYLGRNDDQVKIRGFRIELGEIEARLAACDGVREAVVVVREDEPGDKRLVAYLIAAEGAQPSAAALRTQLLVSLADYMVPNAFVTLDSLPLTTNGKLDRKALPAPDAEAFARREYQAPQGALETTLAGLWSELLGVEQVGRHDQFFELGGHSLLAVKLIERMRQVGLNADVGVLFGQPTLVALAAAAGNRHQLQLPANAIASDCQRITPDMLPLVRLPQAQIDSLVASIPGGVANVQDIYALVPLQEGILFHHQTSTEGDPYLLQALLRMESRERLVDFVEALQQVIARHDILRTSVAWQGLDEPVQVVWREARLPVQEVQLAPSAEDLATQLMQRFNPRHTRMDLTRAPMMALHFAQEPGAEGCVAVLQFHHLIDDATSLALLGAEIEACLQGRADQLAPSVPYRNYVAQTRLGISQAAHEAFFREMLGDVDEPSLPFGLQDVQGDGQGIQQANLPVAAQLGQRLRAQARRLGVSNASLHHLAWGQVVGHLSGRRDVVFGTVLMGRLSSGEDADRAFGMFINTLPLRVEAGAQGVEEALKTTHARLAALLGHEHAPLSLAQRCSGVAAPTPLFSALLNYRHGAVGAQSAEDAGKALRWAGVEMLGGEERTNFPLMLSVDDLGDAFGLSVQAVAGVDPQRVCGYMHRVLEAIADALEHQPEQTLQSLALLPDAERQHLLGDFNAFDVQYPATATVHALFEAQVLRQPDATAVTYAGQALSYGQLNTLANRIAHRLVADGIGVNDRVAICADRSLEMVAGLLAILKAGAGYVPLDPAYPDERLAYMLHDSAPKALLTQQSLLQRFGAAGVPTLCLDHPAGIAAQPAHNPQVHGLQAEALAYVIYTSGSTGQPKGVAMPHGPLVNLMQWQIAQTVADGREAQRTLQFAALGFDVAFQEVFSTLCAGGELSLIHGDVRLNFRQLFRHICEQRIQRLYLPCIALQALAEAVADEPELGALACALSDVITAGEQLRISAQMRALFQHLPGCRLHNHYGPTESHVTTALTLDGDAASWPVLPSIGVPVANTRIYLLDEQLQPVPLGVAGEIYIGGACVARGYLHRDDLTAERFLADPFEAGGRLYKTGDLGRYQPKGEIDYLGRNDGQIKIRGFRVELGEIEARLAQYAGIRDAAVLVREDSPGDKRLVAYFTAEAERALPGIDELRAHLQALLPDYMIPAAYVQMERLPLSPNGKLDRRALPAPQAEAFASREYAPPQGATETALADLWAQVLGVARVGRHDNFFELGGHSLLAVKLIERMRQLGMSADVRVLFGQPTLAALAAAVGGGSEIQVPANRIPADCTQLRADMLTLIDLSQDELDRIVARVPGGARNVQDIYPLAPLQQGILYHHITAEQGDPYLLQATFTLASREQLDTFAQALQAVVARHDITRTALLWEGLERPVQVVLRQAELTVEELHFDSTQGSVLEQLRGHFDPRLTRLDLSRAPLMHLAFAHDQANQRWLALLLFHHIAMDHTALDVISEEVQAWRNGDFAQLGAAMPYRNYVAQALLGVSQAQHEGFFREMLGDVDEPTLPFGLQEVQGDGLGVKEARLNLDPDLCRRLRAQARHLGVSAASLHHLAWARVLASVSGRDDVVFGTVLLGRMQSGDGADRALGLFINTLPLRVDAGVAGVREAVRATHGRLSALLGHEHAPLVVAQRCSGVPATSPLFSSILNYRHSPLLESQGPQYWAGTEVFEVRERTNYPCMLSVDDQGEGFQLGVQATGVDAARVAAYMQTALHSLVEALEHAPNTAVQQLPVLPAAERETLLVAFNATARDYPLQQTLHGLFEAQVERTPDAVAVWADGQRLSYRELNAQANRLAHHLRAHGVQPDSPVAICVERSAEMVVGLLAILKAGGAYVPLDPAYPQERLAYMLEDSAPAVLLVQTATRGLLGDIAVPVVDLDHAGWQHLPSSNPSVAALTPQHSAYVIYTSGSTGQPKGVINEHRAVVNRLLWMQEEYGLGADDSVLQKTPFSFDVSVWEFFWPLFTGARLVMARPGGHKDPQYLCDIIEAEQVTTLHFVPSMLDVFLAHGDVSQAAGLVRVMCSGEALPGSVVRRFKQQLPGSQLFNLYGPTEAAVDVTAWDCSGAQTPDNTPIGKAIANTRMYVLDAHLQPVPLGVSGELYIGGVQVARGYLNRPELTAERFLKDPFSEGRLYRTGDVGRFLADGNIEYLGRNDDQVKIRGLRIELGEIQARLGEFPQILEATVLAREDVPGDKRLVAYYTGVPAATDELRAHLLEQLPEFMVPQVFVHLEAFPLSPNGKLDRKALPAPDMAALRSREYEAPQGDTEIALARLWAELLNVERVGRHDNFFELGGHSLLAVSLIGRMRQKDLNTDVRALFGQPTLAALAASLGSARSNVVVPANRIGVDCQRITPDLVPLVALDQPTLDRIVEQVPGGVANVQDIYPLAPLQAGILFHHLQSAEGDPYVLQAMIGLSSRERLEAFSQGLQRVIERHDALRTAVLWDGFAEPLQVVLREARLVVETLTLDPAQGAIEDQLRARFDTRHHRLNLSEAPLIRIACAADPQNERWLAVLMFHHMIMDHTALELLRQEVQGYLQGQATPLAAAQPYRNYVAQARLGVSEAEHEAFFRDLLGDISEPTLPFGVRDVQGNGSQLRESALALDAELSQRLRRQARQLGVSAASLFHLAWARVLGAVCSSDNAVFGTVLLGRLQGGEGAEQALGLFINTLPLRVDVGSAGVRAAAQATHGRLTALLRHEHAPLALAQRCSGVAAPQPLFSALLNYRHSAIAAVQQDERAWQGIEFFAAQERTNYPLTLSVDDLGDDFRLVALAVDEIGAERICDFMHTALANLVAALEHTPQVAVNQLSILSARERQRVLLELNASAREYPLGQTIHALFEARAVQQPEAIAVRQGDEQLTYRQLDRRANQLAHGLLEHGVSPDDRVAICARRSLETLVGLLAILKAGAAYVPIDPAHPQERICYLLQDSAPKVVLAQSGTRDLLGDSDRPVIALDGEQWHQQPIDNPSVSGLTPRNLAYVIYTSGSTGLPKGVMVEHRTLENLVNWHCDAFDLHAGSHTSSVAGFGFDAMAWEIWPALCVGATLHLPPAQQAHEDIDALLSWWAAQPLDVSFLPTPVAEYAFSQHLEHPTLKTLLIGGDRLRHFSTPQGFTLVNNYGPTEATVVATSGRIDAGRTLHIGRPIANTQVYVLDAQLQPVPLGVAGELYVGGAGVARGYLNRPQMTAERFIQDPFSADPQARLYRTGDLARWLEDGTLDYLGRNDDQVKIRGVRIELGEIETCLGEHPDVREGVVLARDGRLVAYFTEYRALDLDSLRDWLQARLPEAMVPAAYVRLDNLPLTANGKLDRKALPEPDQSAVPSQAYQAPEGEVEVALAALWSEVLKVERIGRHDNFFELGGHSLLAVNLIGRMRQAGLQADVRSLFSQPTLAGLAKVLGSATEVQVPANLISADCTRITPAHLPLANLDQASINRIVASVPGGTANVQDIYALAPLQEGILYHHLSAGQGDPYLLQARFSFADKGRLDAFAQALQAVVDRHDILRTSIVWEGLDTPMQVVWRSARLAVRAIALNVADGDVLSQLHERFDARRMRLDVSQAPLMQLVYAEDPANQRIAAILLFHHLALDHTAMDVVRHEVQASLSGSRQTLGEPVPYRNYVAQARLGVSEQAHEEFFRAQLADIDAPTLPFGLQDVQSDADGIEERSLAVDAALALRLRAQSRQLGVSAASLFHLAWAQVLAAASGQDSVVFGTVLMGRMQGGAGSERALGMFINTLPLRIDLAGQGARASVRATHSRLTALLGHEHASLALAQRCSGVAAPAPLFSALLNYRHSQPAGSESLEGWHGIEVLGGEERTNYPLALNVDELGDAFSLNVLTQTSVGAQRVCRFMHNALEQLVLTLEQAPDAPLDGLSILPTAERDQVLLAFNATATDFPSTQTVHGVFEAQVVARAHAVAAVQGAVSLSYAQLNARANKLAHHLLSLGAAPGDRMAILLERSLDLLVAQLAISKCAAVYVPLDVNAPADRQAFMIEDSGARWVLTTSATEVAGQRLDLDTLDLDKQPEHNPALEQSSETAAYIMYTSGSTGTPKGVLVPHRAITRLVINNGYAEFNQHDRVAFASNPAFDASTLDVWAPLLNGGAVVVVDQDTLLSREAFAALLQEQSISVLWMTAGLFHQYAEGLLPVFPQLRYLIVGGDVLDPSVIARVLKDGAPQHLLNGYGPTEATTFSTTYEIQRVDEGSIPIGKPVGNSRAYVLDARQQPVPVGVAGELYIGGQGVALGYLNRADLT